LAGDTLPEEKDKYFRSTVEMGFLMIEEPLLFTPGPVTLPKAILREMSKPMISHRSKDFRELFEDTVLRLQQVFKTKNDIAVLTASGTGGVEAALLNVLDVDEKILIPVYGVFSKRAAETAKRIGARPVVLSKSLPNKEDIFRLIEDNVDATAILIVYNDTSPGITIRFLKDISRKAKEYGILTIVDAVSILGGDVLLTDEWDLDVVITGSQKCLMSPPGLAAVSLSERAWEKVLKTPRRTFYFDFIRYKEYYEKRKETPFTPAINVLHALRKALEIILDVVGYRAWIEMHRRRASFLYSALSALNFKPIMPPEYRSNTVISVKPPERLSPEEILSRLKNDYGIYAAGGLEEWKGKIIRFGNMGYISPRSLLSLILSIATILMEKEIPLKLEELISVFENLLVK